MSASDKAYKNARRLRRELSLPEKLLWVRLRSAEVRFRRQHPIGPYVLDFYFPAAKLAIEVDGAAHDFGDRPQRDEVRTEWLIKQGIEVLRIPAKDVLADPDEVADALIRLCSPREPPPPLSFAERSPSPRLRRREERGMTAGYSGTPLAKKLSLRDGMRAWWSGMPDSVREEIAAEGLQLQLLDSPEVPIDAAHVFVTERTDLEAQLKQLLPLLRPSGFIWVSWPKKASKVPTDITENVIRDVCLPMGLVDVKVCAVDETWSGLKLVIRKGLR
jgi:very-short-patch-repair endonuclease